MTAPGKADEYKSYWQLRDADGNWFGIGADADRPIWVDISVVDAISDYAYDFALDYCAAAWSSNNGKLPCSGSNSADDGFVTLLKNPNLENRKENEPALWVHPNEKKHGWIEGIYPGFKVKDGDRFRTWVGCLAGYENCNITFRLDYETKDGQVSNLGEWHEVYEGLVTDIDLDLSDLAGKKVRFILSATLNNKKYDDAHGFWFVPHIERTAKVD